MSDLAEVLSKRIAEMPRLRGVPVPVIEEVVREVFHFVEMEMADDQTVKQLLGEWDECEACGDAGMSVTMVRDGGEDNVALCKDCAAMEIAPEAEQS